MGQQAQTPEDVVKNTYTLEFLGIEERKRYKEKNLEEVHTGPYCVCSKQRMVISL